MIPYWTKDTKASNEIRAYTLNAVDESFFEKPSFRSSIPSKRYILGITGFFEWQDVNKSKIPYFIHLPDNEIFSLGCIYNSWTDKITGEIIHSFSIVTSSANSLLERFFTNFP